MFVRQDAEGELPGNLGGQDQVIPSEYRAEANWPIRSWHRAIVNGRRGVFPGPFAVPYINSHVRLCHVGPPARCVFALALVACHESRVCRV